jgi:hypothetical protein
VLLVTLVVLLVLATLGYSLASRVAAQRHRDNYIIDYTNACYARDSALKYALATLQGLNDATLVSRPNEPDFSDLFALSEPDYRRLLEQWAAELAKSQPELLGDANDRLSSGMRDLEGFDEDGNTEYSLDINGANDVNNVYAVEPNTEPNILNLVGIRGPYGPPWPLVTEPVEFQIGSATVKIGIEDENAKYPVGWAVLGDEKVQREAEAGLETFCEWMGFDSARIDSLKGQLKQVGSIKSFKVAFEPTTQRVPVTAGDTRSRRPGARPRRTTYRTTTIPPAEQLTRQARDFSKLFHSSLIDTKMLAAPTIEGREESALKYMSLWGTTQVNINSAPRQVLEAAFAFGGDADKIAAEIIKQRREKPFTDIEELKKQLFSFSSGIEKCKPYITTASSVFAIRVTAVSGVAKASAVIVVLKEGGKIERIAVVCG